MVAAVVKIGSLGSGFTSRESRREAVVRIFSNFGLCFVAMALVLLIGMPSFASIYNNNWKSELSVSDFADSVTGSPSRFTAGVGWTIEPGADDFYHEVYERPTSQGFQSTISGAPAFDNYHEALDIVSGQFAIDSLNGLAYFSINMNGQDELTADGSVDFVGFKHFYRIRISDNADFFGGYMFGVKDPYGNSVGNSFDNSNSYKSTQMWSDLDASWVTGTGLTTTGEGTEGYDEFTSEGDSNKIRSRIVGDSVEFALNYRGLGIDPASLSHFIFEANQGLTDPQNYFWNDKYNFDQAGSPYDPSGPPQNIYELDTLMGGYAPSMVPEPSSVMLWTLLLGLAGMRRRSL